MRRSAKFVRSSLCAGIFFILLLAGCSTTAKAVSDGEGLAAELPSVVAVPKPIFTRAVIDSAPMPEADSVLDRCAGPVAVELGKSWPTLIAEHDYCGGAAWIPNVHVGDAVKLSGLGAGSDIYVASTVKKVPRDGSTRVGDLPAADLVLQTCISKTQMVLVGMTEFKTLREPSPS